MPTCILHGFMASYNYVSTGNGDKPQLSRSFLGWKSKKQRLAGTQYLTVACYNSHVDPCKPPIPTQGQEILSQVPSEPQNGDEEEVCTVLCCLLLFRHVLTPLAPELELFVLPLQQSGDDGTNSTSTDRRGTPDISFTNFCSAVR